MADPFPRRGGGFLLRRLTRDDLPAFQAYRHDPELGRYQGWSPLSDEEAIAFLTVMNGAPFPTIGDWIQIAIAEPATQRLIGDIGVCVDLDEQVATIGFTLARHAQGQGVATAAVGEAISLIFAATRVERIIGISDTRNTASVRLLERLGMRRTDTTQAIFRGEPCLEYVYAIARTDPRNQPVAAARESR